MICAFSASRVNLMAWLKSFLPSLSQQAELGLNCRQIGDVLLDVAIPPFKREKQTDFHNKPFHVYRVMKRRRLAHLRITQEVIHQPVGRMCGLS
jgi:hypothetical protein